MSQFNQVGGRYGMHSGSGKFRNVEVEKILTVAGNAYPAWMCQGDIWYVDGSKAGSGDGTSWDKAFLTITEGIAALSNYDWLIIGPVNYDESGIITMSNLKGVKILGFGTGMQWNEGSTCWRDVSSTLDLLYMTGCQGCEIAGISFIVTEDGKDAINFTGLCYSIHIHDCCFVGDTGGGAEMAYGINADGSKGPDLYVHDCRFLRVKTKAIIMGHQRNVIKNNIFIVPNDGIGIDLPGATASSYNIIADNYFLGSTGGSTNDFGISGGSGTAGNFMIVNNRFANFTADQDMAVGASGDTNCLNNYEDGTNGAIQVVDPST